MWVTAIPPERSRECERISTNEIGSGHGIARFCSNFNDLDGWDFRNYQATRLSVNNGPKFRG